MQSALNEVRASLSLPQIQAVDEEDALYEDSSLHEGDLGNESLDSVEDNTIHPENLASAPIRSLYEVTKSVELQKGRTHSEGTLVEPDFISRDIITLAEAEQLTKFYLGRLDHFFYDYLGQYSDLAQVRKTSTLLAVTLCTVASLHDPLGSELYDKLGRELRNVVGSLLFRQNLGLEDIKALCMAAYWISDMTWILSALAARKATSLQYHTSHLNQPNTDEEGFHQSQMWLLIYLSNEQISILQGAPSSAMGSNFIKFENHIASPFSSETDLRLTSHIDLLLILSRVRELYGMDTTKPIPPILIPQLRDFNVHLDRWGIAWSAKLARNKWLGNFPSEAVKLHWRFAKFYVCSHAFWGLNAVPSPSSASTTLSGDLEDISICAITTAISILQLLIDSEELRASLIGVPHYFHTMFAFAAVFLLKIATRFRQYVNVDVELVFSISKQVLEIFKQCSCARQHLVHRISQGLTKMIEQCESQVPVECNGHIPVENRCQGHAIDRLANIDQNIDSGAYDMQWFDLENFDLLSMSLPTPASMLASGWNPS